MEKLPLPLNKVETIQNLNSNKILETSSDSGENYILDVDFHHPDEIHDGHEEFPLTPTKERNHYQSPGESQPELLEKMGEMTLFSQGK